jgi:RNA polymerase sigma-70 factor, ECF subfamily
MASRSGARVDLFAASLGRRAVTQNSASDTGGDACLVHAARDGDRAAFGQLYNRYARMVHGVLMARVPASDVDDLVQDVFVLALRRLYTLRDIARFGPWLAAISRNVANDYHRQSVTAVEFSDQPSDSQAKGVVAGGLNEDEGHAILAAIRNLPDAYKETLSMRLIEGMTGREIAARTGLTPGSVRVNLHRGMQQLRERLGRASSGSGSREEK